MTDDSSCNSLTRIQVGTNVVPLDLARQRRLKRDHPLGWHSLTMQPHRDMGLANPSAGDLGQGFGNRRLPSVLTDGVPNRLKIGFHGPEYNTGSVIAVNTRSVFRLGQTHPMPKSAGVSEFWARLTEARTSHKPELSMRQEDVARDAGVAGQSAVTKWKTGKGKPRPEIIEKLAIQADVSFEWLYSGRGDMRVRQATDPLTMQVIEAVESLTPAGKVEVLKAAIMQQTLTHPAVAAQVREAERIVDKLTHQRRRSAG